MADFPPTLPVPPVKPATAKGRGNLLPDSSKYPVLVSGQVSFTTAAAIKDIDQVPQNVYRIQVDLKPRTRDKTFKEVPWTLVARHFFSTILLQDEKAIILRKKATAAVNKITSPEELPENPEIFERDYAYDVNMKNQKLVSFKILIATTKTFAKTFREGIMYRKLSANEWFVKYIRLESQGTVAEIGNLMYAHNRFVNQADLIQEIRNLIHPTICNEIDITVTKASEYFYDKDKKERVYTRWPTIICPLDIAPQLSQILMEKWDNLHTDKRYKNFNLRNTVFVPRNKSLVPFNARIDNIAKQNEFLRNYQDVTVIRNCVDITAEFTFTQEMAEMFGQNERRGHVLSLREFLQSWEDHTTGRPAIVAINRTHNINEYSLLTGRINKLMIHDNIIKLVEKLRGQAPFKNLEVGGTKGTQTRLYQSDKVKKYTTRWQNSERNFNQKPSSAQNKDQTINNDKNEEENKWKTPPVIKRRTQKEIKTSIIVDYNDTTLVQHYRDVTNMNNKYEKSAEAHKNNETPKNGNKQLRRQYEDRTDETNSITRDTQLSTLTDSTFQERRLTTSQQIHDLLNSKKFKETLAEIVAPQVSNLIEPTVKKINHIETQVGVLHEHVQNNNEWQHQQTTRQESMQQDMNNMTTGMNQVQESINMMMKMYMDRDTQGGNKRSAPNSNETTAVMPSPQRRQRMQNKDTLITQESITGIHLEQNIDMAHKPSQLEETYPPSEDNDNMQESSEGEGES